MTSSTRTPPTARWKSAVGWLVTLATAALLAGVIIWTDLSFNFVATDSMLPTYKPTDIIVTVGPHIKTPEVGQAVVFTADFFETHIPPHVHRIVGVEPDGNWITKGDNATNPDPWRVRPEAVTGIVITSVPGAILRSPLLLGGALFAAVIVLLWPRDKEEDVNPQHGSARPDLDDEEAKEGPALPQHAACRPPPCPTAPPRDEPAQP